MSKTLLAKILLAFLLLGTTTAEAQLFKKKKNKKEQAGAKPDPKKNKIKPYNKVITKEAISDEGLFTTHQVDDKHYYEIPDSLFNKEMLMVTRISKTANGIGFGGGKINTQVLRWEKKSKKYSCVWSLMILLQLIRCRYMRQLSILILSQFYSPLISRP